VPRLWEPLAAKRRPANGYAAKFSLPYLVATMLVRGEAGLACFTDEAVGDGSVLRVAEKVGYEVDPTIDYPRQFSGHVLVRLADGRVVEARQEHPRGGPDFPLTRDELEAKFRGNAALVLSAERIERVIREVERLPRAPRLEGLAALLRRED
jgi:2-methylcitrate dehydratase PrpD